MSVDGKVIIENTAILTYLARRFPEKELMPADPIEEARRIAMMAWFSNAVHPPYRQALRPERFAESEAAAPAVKEMGRKLFWAGCAEIDSLLKGKTWIMGNQYTVADPYALVFYGWGVRAALPLDELENYTAWKDRMLERPAVRKILESEQNVLVKPA